MKINRIWSFIILAAVYAASGVVGVLSYLYLPESWPFWARLLAADVIATAVTFVFSCIFKNASVYDPYWSVQPPVILASFAFGKELSAVRVLLLVAVFFWAIRLTANWAYTFMGMEHQDWRYTQIKEKTGKLYPIVNFLGIHLVPTLVVYGCILPAVFTFVYDPPFNAGSAVFFTVSVLAACLQLVADAQMHKYRKNRTGRFIRTGLWKYSRHPNYLGEILMWWGVGLAVVCVMPDRWYLLAGALANTLMFLFISIPLADGRQSRKDGFAEYKVETRMLLPIKKRAH